MQLKTEKSSNQIIFEDNVNLMLFLDSYLKNINIHKIKSILIKFKFKKSKNKIFDKN